MEKTGQKGIFLPCFTPAFAFHHAQAKKKAFEPDNFLPLILSDNATVALSDRSTFLVLMDILKMDIEGWEWVALPQVLNMTGDRGRILPRQIAVEVHLATHQRYDVPGFVSKGARAVLPRHQEQLRELRRSMEAAGYALVDRNDNPWCGHCSELLFVRVDSSFTVSADSAAGRRFYPVVATLFASIVTACPFL